MKKTFLLALAVCGMGVMASCGGSQTKSAVEQALDEAWGESSYDESAYEESSEDENNAETEVAEDEDAQDEVVEVADADVDGYDADAVSAFVNSDEFKTYCRKLRSTDADDMMDALEYKRKTVESLIPEIRKLNPTAIAKQVELDKMDDKYSVDGRGLELRFDKESMTSEQINRLNNIYLNTDVVPFSYKAEGAKEYGELYRKLRYGW